MNKNKIIFLITILGVFIMLNCFSQKNSKLFTDLLAKDETTRNLAKEQLDKIKFNKKDLPLIYDAIKKDYPDDTANLFPTREKLLRILWDLNDDKTIGFIKEIYKQLPVRDDFKFSALRILSQMNTNSSVMTLVSILLDNAPDFNNSYHVYTLFVPFYSDPKNASLLFPSLFQLLNKPQYAYNIYCLAVEFRSQKLLSDSIFLPIKDKLIKDYKEAVSQVNHLKHSQEDSSENRDLIAVLVDCMGSIKNDSTVLNILESSLDDEFPRTSLCACLSILRQGKNVPESIITKIAANPELRLALYDELIKLGRKELFPSQFLTQFSFAEADIVRWLCYPTEFGRPPQKIELIGTKELVIDGEPGRLYLFKYFYPDDDGWMVGISGPFPLDKSIIKETGGMTFSHFTKLDSVSIEEHWNSFLKEKE